MQALLVIDVQNEFSKDGQRAIEHHDEKLAQIRRRVAEARAAKIPIAWVRHFNLPHESPAFQPETWGSEFSTGMGPQTGFGPETEFHKNVYGAFTGTSLEFWLRSLGVNELVIVGFYTHMCVSTTTREALMRDYKVTVDPKATGAAPLKHPELGEFTAEEIHRSALLQLVHMGAQVSEAVAAKPLQEAVRAAS